MAQLTKKKTSQQQIRQPINPEPGIWILKEEMDSKIKNVVISALKSVNQTKKTLTERANFVQKDLERVHNGLKWQCDVTVKEGNLTRVYQS